MFRIPQIVLFLFLGQSSVLAAQAPPTSIGALELNELLADTYCTSTFDGTLVFEVGLSDGFPEVGGLSARIPIRVKKCADGVQLNFDSTKMELNIPDALSAEIGVEEIPEMTFQLQISNNSGLLFEFDGPDGKVAFYINPEALKKTGAIFEMVIDSQMLAYSGMPLPDEEIKNQLAKSLPEFLANPENPRVQQEFLAPLLSAAFKDAKIYLVQKKDGTASYSGDIYEIWAVGTHRSVALLPWDQMYDLRTEQDWDEFGITRKHFVNIRAAELDAFRGLASACRKIMDVELFYDFQMLPAGQPFFTGTGIQVSFGAKDALGPALKEIIERVAQIVEPGNPQVLLDQIYAGGDPTEDNEFLEFANAVGGQSGFFDFGFDGLDLSPIAAGAFDFSIAGRTDVQDVSPMVLAYLPMVEMAIQQELGVGGAAGAELEF